LVKISVFYYTTVRLKLQDAVSGEKTCIFKGFGEIRSWDAKKSASPPLKGEVPEGRMRGRWQGVSPDERGSFVPPAGDRLLGEGAVSA
jgi:hypothetical protein